MSTFVREAVLVRDSFFFACIPKGAGTVQVGLYGRGALQGIVFSEGSVRFYAGRVVGRPFVRQVGVQVWAGERVE